MSREQWGHGYWKGRQDEQKNPEGPRYIGLYNSEDDPYLNCLGQIREKHQGILVVEWLDYFEVMLAITFGYEPSWKEVVLENVKEISVDDITCDYKLFYSWKTAAGEMIIAEKAMTRKYHDEQQNQRQARRA